VIKRAKIVPFGLNFDNNPRKIVPFGPNFDNDPGKIVPFGLKFDNNPPEIVPFGLNFGNDSPRIVPFALNIVNNSPESVPNGQRIVDDPPESVPFGPCIVEENYRDMLGACKSINFVINFCLATTRIGSRFDRVGGVFSWSPGPVFLGDYRLVFIDKGRNRLRKINIRILPGQTKN
jgi:hypothetical protein